MVPRSTDFAYIHLPEAMLETTFTNDQLSKPERRDRLRLLGEIASDILLEDWEQDSGHTKHGIKIAAMYACLPSLQTCVDGAPHTLETAQEVSNSLADLSEFLTSHEFEEGTYERPKKEQGGLFGQMSELAVLGTMWWGIANGYRSEDSYVLPSRTQEDLGRRKEGYNLASDLVLRRTGSKVKDPIQIKANDSRGAKRKIRNYHPSLAVVTASNLAQRPTRRPFQLLRAVATGDRFVLGPANQQIDDQLQQARKRGIEYRRELRADRAVLA